MNPVTVGLGAFMIAFGLFTLWGRQARPDMFSKLKAMKEMWGEGPGLALHVVAYTVMPIVCGTGFVLAGSNGVALF